MSFATFPEPLFGGAFDGGAFSLSDEPARGSGPSEVEVEAILQGVLPEAFGSATSPPGVVLAISVLVISVVRGRNTTLSLSVNRISKRRETAGLYLQGILHRQAGSLAIEDVDAAEVLLAAGNSLPQREN